MKKERQELELELDYMIEKYNCDKKIKENITNDLNERKIDVVSILEGNRAVETLDGNELYLLTKAFYIHSGESKINPERYFLENEIQEAEKYYKDVTQTKKYPLIIKNILKISEDHFKTILSVQEIENLYNRGIINYNPKTQRETKKILRDGLIFEQPSVNRQSVKDIQNDLLNKKFISNDLTFNLLLDGTQDYIYDEKNKILKINGGRVDAIDGFHRNLGILGALTIEPELEYIFGINITVFDEEKAKRYIVQEDKKNKISKQYLSNINPDKLENIITQRINEKSDIKGKIGTSDIAVSSGRALTNWDIVSNSINHNFNYKTQREAIIIADWLSECFNELAFLRTKEMLDEILKSREENYINHPNMFIGYIALFAKLQGNSKWRDELKNALNKVDFSKRNEIWGKDELDIEVKTIKNTQIKDISNYFKSLV